MPTRNPIPRIVLILGVPLGLLLFALVACVVFRIPISLNSFRPTIDSSLEKFLGREVTIDGSVDLVLGLRSGLRVAAIEVMNPDDWPGGKGKEEGEGKAEGSFVKVDRVHAEVDLFQLLRRRIEIDLLHVDGVTIALAERADGAVNWRFDDAVFSKPKGEDAAPAEGDGYAVAGIEGVAIRNLAISLTDAAGKRRSVLQLDELTGGTSAGKPMALMASGSFFGRHIKTSLTGGTRDALLAREDPWPFSLKGKLGPAEFTHEGRLAAKGAAQPERYHFRIEIPKLDELEPVTGSLPDAGPLSFSGELQFEKGGFRLPEVAGTLGEASLTGHFAADFSGESPRVDGALTFESLELAKLRDRDDQGNDAGKGSGPVFDLEERSKSAAGSPDADEARALFGFVGRLEIAVGRLIGKTTEARDIAVVLNAKEDGASLQASAEFDKSRFETTADLRRSPGAGLQLEAKGKAADVQLGNLLGLFSDATGVTGRSESIAVRYQGSGENLKEIRERAEMELSAGRSGLTIARGGESVELQLESASLQAKAEGPGEIEASGILKEEAFSVKGTFATGMEEARVRLVSCEVAADGAGATIRVERPEEKEGYSFSIKGERLGDLASWIGTSPEADISYAVTGRFLSDGDGAGWQIDALEGQIGADRFSGSLGQTVGGPDDSGKLMKIDLSLPTVNAEAIKHMFGVIEEDEETAGGIDLDLPIFPGDIRIVDADVALAVERLIFPKRELTDVKVTADLRAGWVEVAPFEASFAGTRFHGDSAWDFRGGDPKVSFDLAAENVALGRVLSDLGVVEKGVEATAAQMNLVIHSRGGTLREILRQSKVDASLKDGVWKLRDSNTKGEVNLTFDEATVTALAGEPLRFELKGKISDTPLTFQGQTDALTAFAEESKDMHLRFEAILAGTQLVLDEKVALPLDRSDFSGKIVLESRDLSDLSDLVDVHLPAWGPCRLESQLRVLDDGYAFENFTATVGESDLSGTLRILIKGARPRFTANLKSARFQINDFHKEGWSPYGPSGVLKADSVPGERLDQIHARLAAVLSPGVLTSFDGQLSVKADAVYSQSERLGDGSLVAELQNGKLRIAPASLNIPGGNVQCEFNYAHLGSQVEAGIMIKMSDFDYGIIARRKDPASNAAGLINIDADLNSLSPVPGKFLAYGNGRIGFSVCPEQFGAEVMDLWATNLMVAMLPRLDPEKKSKINCLLGEFTLSDGVLHTDKFLIDATRVRAEGSGTVDLKKEIVNLTFVPKAKTPQLLNLATAITVDGTFDNFRKRVTAADAIRTVSGATARTVLFPLRFLTEKRMPEDGSDICPCAKGR